MPMSHVQIYLLTIFSSLRSLSARPTPFYIYPLRFIPIFVHFLPLKHSPVSDLLLRRHMFYFIYAGSARCYFLCFRIYLCLFPHRCLTFPWNW
ncbi:hypothetical protein BDW72DRAFT_184366 [Aspergillus terricola var. indicus]